MPQAAHALHSALHDPTTDGGDTADSIVTGSADVADSIVTSDSSATCNTTGNAPGAKAKAGSALVPSDAADSRTGGRCRKLALQPDGDSDPPDRVALLTRFLAAQRRRP